MLEASGAVDTAPANGLVGGGGELRLYVGAPFLGATLGVAAGSPAVLALGSRGGRLTFPNISSLHGTCQPDHTCTCTAPSTKDPQTGKCT